MSKKCCTFAPAFEKSCPLVYRYYTGFWFREARFDSSVDNKKAAVAAFVVKSQKSKEKGHLTTCDGIHGIK